jgi:hypothetical protein
VHYTFIPFYVYDSETLHSVTGQFVGQ